MCTFFPPKCMIPQARSTLALSFSLFVTWTCSSFCHTYIQDSIVEGDEYEDDEDDAEGEENEVGEAVEPRAAGPLSEVVLGGSSCSSWQGAPEPPEPGVTSPPCGSSPRRPPSSMGAGASSQHGLPAAPAPAGQGLEEVRRLGGGGGWLVQHAEVGGNRNPAARLACVA